MYNCNRPPRYSVAFVVVVNHSPRAVIGVSVAGSVTLVFLPLKYEIDDSVTVTVVLG